MLGCLLTSTACLFPIAFICYRLCLLLLCSLCVCVASRNGVSHLSLCMIRLSSSLYVSKLYRRAFNFVFFFCLLIFIKEPFSLLNISAKRTSMIIILVNLIESLGLAIGIICLCKRVGVWLWLYQIKEKNCKFIRSLESFLMSGPVNLSAEKFWTFVRSTINRDGPER